MEGYFGRPSPNQLLVGGFNPFEKYQSKWESCPSRGENRKYLKPPTIIYSEVALGHPSFLQRPKTAMVKLTVLGHLRATAQLISSNSFLHGPEIWKKSKN